MESVSLKRVPLSVRASNVLYRMGLSSVEDFMRTPIDDIAAQRNIGEKTLREIERIRGEIARGELAFMKDSSVPDESPSYTEEDLQEMSRYSIDELELSNRSYNALMNAELFRMDRLAVVTGEELAGLRNFGKKSQEEVESALEHWLEEHGFGRGQGDVEGDDPSEDERVYFQRMMRVLEPLTHIYWKNLWRDAKSSGRWDEVVRGGWDSLEEENWHAVFRLPILESKLKFAMRHMMKEDVLKKTEFSDRCRKAAPLLDGELWLRYGIEEGLLQEHRGCYLLKRDMLLEVLRSREDDSRETEMLRMRFQGKSLQEIGDFFSLSRERVRQVVQRELESFPPLFEDYFVVPLESFQWTKEDFFRLFPELGKVGVEYLFQRYRDGKEPLSEASAEEYFGVWRDRLMEYLKK